MTIYSESSISVESKLIPNARYYIFLLIGLIVCSMVLAKTANFILTPAINGNSIAYAELIEGMNSGKYAVMADSAAMAYNKAIDPDLKKMADFLHRSSLLIQNTGIVTVQEGNTFTGLTKAFIAGFTNPLSGVEGASIALETFLTNPDALGKKLDNRYLPLYARIGFARTCATIIFYLTLIGGLVGYIFAKSKIEPLFLTLLQHIRLLQIKSS